MSRTPLRGEKPSVQHKPRPHLGGTVLGHRVHLQAPGGQGHGRDWGGSPGGWNRCRGGKVGLCVLTGLEQACEVGVTGAGPWWSWDVLLSGSGSPGASEQMCVRGAVLLETRCGGRGLGAGERGGQGGDHKWGPSPTSMHVGNPPHVLQMVSTASWRSVPCG